MDRQSREEVWVAPEDDVSNRSIVEALQAGEEDFSYGVLVGGVPRNLIRVRSASLLATLREARRNGAIRFREVRQASAGAQKRDVTAFTTSPPRRRARTRPLVLPEGVFLGKGLAPKG